MTRWKRAEDYTGGRDDMSAAEGEEKIMCEVCGQREAIMKVDYSMSSVEGGTAWKSICIRCSEKRWSQ
jgi:hypothetical protein